MRIHIVPSGQWWRVKKDDLHAGGSAFPTKREAVQHAYRNFPGAELVIHTAHGGMASTEQIPDKPVTTGMGDMVITRVILDANTTITTGALTATINTIDIMEQPKAKKKKAAKKSKKA